MLALAYAFEKLQLQTVFLRVFADNTEARKSYENAGGWMCKSPLCREKLAAYGIETAEEALLGEGVYFIMSDAEKSDRGLEWLQEYYAEKGTEVEILEQDRIGENYQVYRVAEE